MLTIRLPRELSTAKASNDVGDAVLQRARDARIDRALAAMESAPAERWTVAKLAKVAGLSRAAFARRFAAEVGASPLRHLRAVRLGRVAELLSTTDASLADAAARVGYASEFALSRAFRRVVGIPPGVFRRRARDGQSFAPRCIAA
jgi:transcriptional regulator GlxA family with amidase domain